MTSITLDRGRWRTSLTYLNDTQAHKGWWMILYYDGRIYKVKKFPTSDSAMRWALDVQRAVDAGIQSDPL